MSKNDGGPAFPSVPHHETVKGADWGGMSGHDLITEHVNGRRGMSLRDWFAGQVVNGICHGLVHGIRPADIVNLTRDAYGIADAMLAERSKP